jgi:hypothetical protein
MRTLQFMPLVLVAGVDGFNLFVPYLALVGAAAIVISRVKRKSHPLPLAH